MKQIIKIKLFTHSKREKHLFSAKIKARISFGFIVFLKIEMYKGFKIGNHRERIEPYLPLNLFHMKNVT